MLRGCGNLACNRNALSLSLKRLLSSSRREDISKSLVPEGLPKGLAARFAHLSQSSLVPRSCDRVIDSLVLPSSTPSHRTVFLDGPRGVGKSAALLRAVCFARESGAIALYIPSAREWTHGGSFFSAATVPGKDVVKDGPDAVRYYDRPRQTLQALEGMLACHGDALDELDCAVESSLLDASSSGRKLKTVRDVLQYGVDLLRDVDADWRMNPKLGGDVFVHVVRELSVQEAVPFLLAVDDYNSFLGMTSLVSGNARSVHSCGIRAVGEVFGREALVGTVTGMKRGVALLGLNKSHGAPKWRKSRILGTVDYPASEDVLQDPTGATWLEKVREFSSQLSVFSSGSNDVPALVDSLLDEDSLLDATSVSAANLAVTGVQFVDIPEWTVAEADMLLADFLSAKKMVELKAPDRHRLVELAGGRADILHRLCMAY